MNRVLAKILIKLFPIRWIIVDYSLFKPDYHLYRVRGRFNTWLVSETWIIEHSAGQADIFGKRPRWKNNHELVRMA